MFTSEKREMRARRGGRAKSSQAYPKIRRELFESPTKSGDADSASQRKDTNELLSKSVITCKSLGDELGMRGKNALEYYWYFKHF